MWALRQASMTHELATEMLVRADRLANEELLENDGRWGYVVEYVGTLSTILEERQQAADTLARSGIEHGTPGGGAARASEWLAGARYRMQQWYGVPQHMGTDSPFDPNKHLGIDAAWLSHDAMNLVDESLAAELDEYKREQRALKEQGWYRYGGGRP